MVFNFKTCTLSKEIHYDHVTFGLKIMVSLFRRQQNWVSYSKKSLVPENIDLFATLLLRSRSLRLTIFIFLLSYFIIE